MASKLNRRQFGLAAAALSSAAARLPPNRRPTPERSTDWRAK